MKESLYIRTYADTADRLLVAKKISVKFNIFDCSVQPKSLYNILMKNSIFQVSHYYQYFRVTVTVNVNDFAVNFSYFSIEMQKQH